MCVKVKGEHKRKVQHIKLNLILHQKCQQKEKLQNSKLKNCW
jgi:hypothetical protein